jgi:ribosome biogenesis GTPase A
VISTSPYPGTTINTISIPMDNDSQIIDTPGILIADSYAYTLEPHVINKIVPRSEIKPRIYQLNCKQGIIIGGLAKIKIKEGPRANYVLYASNEVEVLRCKDDKIDATFNSLIAGNKISPLSNSIKGGEDLVDHHLILPEKKIDVVIAGLMWITLKGAGQKIIVSCKKGINVVLREPKF